MLVIRDEDYKALMRMIRISRVCALLEPLHAVRVESPFVADMFSDK